MKEAAWKWSREDLLAEFSDMEIDELQAAKRRIDAEVQLAFPTPNPDPEAVKRHVATNFDTGQPYDKHPVLYSFGVQWDRQLRRVRGGAR